MSFDHEHEQLGRLPAPEAANGNGAGGELVLAEMRTIERPGPAALPAVRTAAVAASGFAAGMATVALAQRRRARRRGSRRKRGVERLPIVGSRSFLVDIHLVERS